MGKDGAPSQTKFMLLQVHMFAHLFSGNIHSPSFVQQISFLVHTKHSSRYRSEHDRSRLCIHGAFLRKGRTEREQSYVYKYRVSMVLSVTRSIETGKREREYRGWEDTAVHSGWLRKASLKRVTFEQKPKNK